MRGRAMNLSATGLQRFWSRVQKDNMSGCWLWTGGCKGGGKRYGIVRVGTNIMKADRVSYELAGKKVEKGELLIHRCGNSLCVNPDHLRTGDRQCLAEVKNELGTTSPGNARTPEERVSFRGAAHGAAKLTDDAVLEIHRRLGLGESQASVARDMGVNRTTIHRIARNHRWTSPSGRYRGEVLQDRDM